MPLLAANQVTKVFGGLTAVNRVDLEIEKKTIASLIGPNGAGKTTFFNCLTGLYKPEGGELLFDGQPLIRQTPRPNHRAGHRPHLSEHPPIRHYDSP